MGKESIVKIVLTCIVKNIPLEIPFHERYVLQDFDVFLGMDKTISVLRQYLDDFKLPVRHEILGFVHIENRIGEQVFLPEVQIGCLTVSNSNRFCENNPNNPPRNSPLWVIPEARCSCENQMANGN